MTSSSYQYAITSIGGHDHLADFNEARCLDTHQDSISDGPLPDKQLSPLTVVYGAYLPPPGVSGEKALTDALGAKGNWLGPLRGDSCRLIALQDIRVFGVVKAHSMARVPFAVLIQAEPTVVAAIKQDEMHEAVTAFVRYSNMPPADNVLNRLGVFAFKVRVQPEASQPMLGDWHTLVDRDRALRLARKIM